MIYEEELLQKIRDGDSASLDKLAAGIEIVLFFILAVRSYSRHEAA